MLRPEEIDRIKYELGVSPTRLGAEPYITYLAVFDRAIQPYLYDLSTTSTTAVTGASTTPITLAANPTAPNGSGLTFQMGTNCVIDVGPNQEFAVIQVLSGLVATIAFANAHPAGFYIAPYGAEALVRDTLSRLDVLKDQLRTIAPTTAGVSRVDTIALYGGGGKGASKYAELIAQRDTARDDLGDLVNFPNLRRGKRSSGGMTFEPY